MSELKHDISKIRNDYSKKQLNESMVHENPIEQFKVWFQEALNSEVPEVNAFVLATVSKDNKPSARVVLLKGIENNGFDFYTNYTSRKANEIEANKNVAMVFFWHELERQVRIEGGLEKTTEQNSDEYFKSRPRESQIGAWSSPQSAIIDGRNVIENNVEKISKEFENKDVTRPKHWGGYHIVPSVIEFWQGRPNRLHDRIQYRKKENGNWEFVRLAP